jgi:hypothetical protein
VRDGGQARQAHTAKKRKNVVIYTAEGRKVRSMSPDPLFSLKVPLNWESSLRMDPEGSPSVPFSSSMVMAPEVATA